MAITLASITEGQQIEPPRILLYGQEGIGKSTFAAQAPNPIFGFTEKGWGTMSLRKFPLWREWGDVVESFRALLSEEHEFQTLVVDTVDWLETIIWAKTCEDGGKESIEDFGYGKGYVQALKYWDQFVEMCDALHEERGMGVILVAHAAVKTFSNPEGDNYDQYQLALHQKAAATLKEWADCVLFARYEVKVRKLEGGVQKDKGKAMKEYGEPTRLLHTEERAAYWAKNRYGLPATLPFDWKAFADALDAGIAKKAALVERLQKDGHGPSNGAAAAAG